mgnify:CR=1 FL=1
MNDEDLNRYYATKSDSHETDISIVPTNKLRDQLCEIIERDKDKHEHMNPSSNSENLR